MVHEPSSYHPNQIFQWFTWPRLAVSSSHIYLEYPPSLFLFHHFISLYLICYRAVVGRIRRLHFGKLSTTCFSKPWETLKTHPVMQTNPLKTMCSWIPKVCCILFVRKPNLNITSPCIFCEQKTNITTANCGRTSRRSYRFSRKSSTTANF